jgi:putative FmdB family regulatory protein
MPTYNYACSECNYELDAVQKMADAPLVSCPNCHNDKLVKQLTAPAYCKTSKTCKTVGQQAELNAKRLGASGLEMLAMEDRIAKAKGREVFKDELRKAGVQGTVLDRPKETPWYRDGVSEKPIDLTKIKDTTKYIKTGETD